MVYVCLYEEARTNELPIKQSDTQLPPGCTTSLTLRTALVIPRPRHHLMLCRTYELEGVRDMLQLKLSRALAITYMIFFPCNSVLGTLLCLPYREIVAQDRRCESFQHSMSQSSVCNSAIYDSLSMIGIVIVFQDPRVHSIVS